MCDIEPGAERNSKHAKCDINSLYLLICMYIQ